MRAADPQPARSQSRNRPHCVGDALSAQRWGFHSVPDEALYRSAHERLSGLIRGFVPWAHDPHAEHLAFLREHVQPGDVVITHHLPHPRSIAPAHARSDLNRFFLAGDAAELVEQSGARLWVHGHTHTPCNYVEGKTQVVCNPRGYPHEMSSFNPGLVVTVGDDHLPATEA